MKELLERPSTQSQPHKLINSSAIRCDVVTVKALLNYLFLASQVVTGDLVTLCSVTVILN